MAPILGRLDWGVIVLVLVLVLVPDLSFFVEPEEAKKGTGIDYENEDEDD